MARLTRNGRTFITVADSAADRYLGAGWQQADGEAASDLDDMTKAELIDEAARREVEVAASWTKAEIIDALGG